MFVHVTLNFFFLNSTPGGVKMEIHFHGEARLFVTTRNTKLEQRRVSTAACTWFIYDVEYSASSQNTR